MKGVIRLALFGSVLRGQTHADSDGDVLVQFASGVKTDDRNKNGLSVTTGHARLARIVGIGPQPAAIHTSST
jgi:predicted nucleotidyltransferase